MRDTFSFAAESRSRCLMFFTFSLYFVSGAVGIGAGRMTRM